jgi:hypothetical protein
MLNSEKLLTEEERDTCQEIAAAGDELAGQRAAALLAIDEGATRAQASQQTNLTLGQIGYLLHAFQQKRLAMFAATAPIEKEQQPEETVEPETEAGKPKEAKKAKGKKEKAKKKDKKSKKGKKGKAKKGKAAKKKSKKK